MKNILEKQQQKITSDLDVESGTLGIVVKQMLYS